MCISGPQAISPLLGSVLSLPLLLWKLWDLQVPGFVSTFTMADVMAFAAHVGGDTKKCFCVLSQLTHVNRNKEEAKKVQEA